MLKNIYAENITFVVGVSIFIDVGGLFGKPNTSGILISAAALVLKMFARSYGASKISDNSAKINPRQ